MSDRSESSCGSRDGPGSPRNLERLCLHNVLDFLNENLYFKDLDSRFFLLSREWLDEKAPGLSASDVIGKTDSDIFSEPHAATTFEDEQRIIRTGQPIVGKVERETFRNRPDVWVSTSKFPLRDDDGRIIGTFGVSRDVTAQIESELALIFQSLHDTLTGLANQAALVDRLTQALVGLDGQPGRIALLFVDLDNFRSINDSFGREAGDKVLCEVARRLTSVAKRADTVARIGGDEFVMLCTTLHDGEDPRLLGDRVVRAIGQSFADEDADLTVTGSVGIVLTCDPNADPAQLLKDARIATHRAKKAGRNCFQVFVPSHCDRELANHTLELELREALDASELFLLYQPFFSLKDRSLRGAEALVHWRHPTRGVVPAQEFIPLAEERSLITRIDGFVLDEACRQLAVWMKEGGWSSDFMMAVNIFGRELADPSVAARLDRVLVQHGLDASRLCLEITEAALDGEAGDIERSLAALSGLGVRIALDNFGTGYSTLAHRRRLRADILKIDGSIVEQIVRSAHDRDFISAVAVMAHALGMVVVGERVETNEQLERLVSLGCDLGQGFLLARPLSPEAVAQLRLRTPSLASATAGARRGRRIHAMRKAG